MPLLPFACEIDATPEKWYLVRLYFPQGGEHECVGIVFIGCLHVFVEFVCNEPLKHGYASQIEYFIPYVSLCRRQYGKTEPAGGRTSSDSAAGCLLSRR